MTVLGLVALAFLADDVASLARQRQDIPAADLATAYAERANRERAAPLAAPAVSDKAS